MRQKGSKHLSQDSSSDKKASETADGIRDKTFCSTMTVRSQHKFCVDKASYFPIFFTKFCYRYKLDGF